MLHTNQSKDRLIHPMKVLLVEDSALLRDVITESLADCIEIAIVNSAATQTKAIDLLESQQFDMLLVDIELAQGNGFEVIKHTQSANYQFQPPVLIMLTNHTYPYYRLMAKQLGVNYFFDKSMDFELAIDTITYEAEKFKVEHKKHN